MGFIKDFLMTCLVAVVGLLNIILIIVKIALYLGAVCFWFPQSTSLFFKVKKEIEMGYIGFIFTAGSQLTAIHLLKKPELLIKELSRLDEDRTKFMIDVINVINNKEIKEKV